MLSDKEIVGKLDPAVEYFKTEIANIRTNRPSAKLIENIKVTYHEGSYPIRQLGAIMVQPPREIHVSCFDPASAPNVAQAIEASGLGVSASPEGSLVRVKLPILTDERRADLIKLVKQITEQTRIRIRGTRDELNRSNEAEFKSKQITEDQKFRTKGLIQKLVDERVREVEQGLARKILEIEE